MALGCMEHRGGCSADNDSGDGAGLLTNVPWELFKRDLPDLKEAHTGCDPQRAAPLNRLTEHSSSSNIYGRRLELGPNTSGCTRSASQLCYALFAHSKGPLCSRQGACVQGACVHLKPPAGASTQICLKQVSHFTTAECTLQRRPISRRSCCGGSAADCC